jgi:methyltransferase-like protein
MTDQVENAGIEEGTIAADSLHPAAKPVTDDAKSKFSYIASMIGAMHSMKKEDLVDLFTKTQALYGPGKDFGVGDKSGSNQSTLDMHASDAQATTGPKTRDAMPKLSVKEDVEEMLAGQELSEEFREKVTTLFEAAVNARALVETARLEEEFDAKLEEAVTEINEELTSKVDTYLDYVVENWIEENKVAIESTLRNEVMGEFIDGLKNLFAEHYIEMPEEKIDVVESLATKVEDLEAMLDEVISEKAELEKAFVEVEKTNVFESYLNDLALSQQEKFKALAEGIDFDGDIETYSKKLAIIKENYFVGEKTAPVSTNIEEETFEVETDQKVASIDPTVNRYVEAISRTLKK